MLKLGVSEVRLLNAGKDDDKIGVAAEFTARFTSNKSDYETLEETVGLNSVTEYDPDNREAESVA